jgi:hypothetical protein
MKNFKSRSFWSHILIILGSAGMLVGAIDPLEGSLVILPGSLMVAIGTFLGQDERRLIAYRVLVFILISIGVGAVWGLTMVGGFGGNERSMWWGLLTLPYLIGWSMGIWGPGSPRWVLLAGIVVGLWYLAILMMVLKRSGLHFEAVQSVPVITLALIGMITIVGCIIRLNKRISKQP